MYNSDPDEKKINGKREKGISLFDEDEDKKNSIPVSA
jgi:hypothetical protein